MADRIKKINNLQDLELAMNELQTMRAKIMTTRGTADEKIAQTRSAIIAETGTLEEEAIRLQNLIETFATKNRDDEELFGEKKSLNLASGTIGFKLGRPSITLEDGFTTDDVVHNLEESRLKTCVTKTTKIDVDKAAVMKLYKTGKLTDEQLKDLGLQVSQSESFFIELKTVDKD
jgi:phage host-nuclease inhibitor protein Gam